MPCDPGREHMMDPHAPILVGPPQADRCERCEAEPAEHRAKLWFGRDDDDMDDGRATDGEWISFDLCGTCWLHVEKDADRTPGQSWEFWGKHKDVRFSDEDCDEEDCDGKEFL